MTVDELSGAGIFGEFLSRRTVRVSNKLTYMGKKLLKYTTYLVSKSTFLTGMGQIFDTAGSYQKYNAMDSSLA